MIELTRPQLSFAEGLIEEEVGPLWEEWMRQVDALLVDAELVQIVYEALARRSPHSRTRGRPATPAEVVLRLLLLKHMRNWSYYILEREVRANLVYRQFTRVGAEKVPDAKTLGRLAIALGPEIIEQIHRRVIAIACDKRFAEEVATGRKRARGRLEQIGLEANRAYLERMIPLVRQVMHQARERLFRGNTHVPGKLVSVFEPHTEVIRKGKAAKPTEFGKMVKIQEAEAQIVTHYEVYDERPSDCDLLLPAIALHEQLLGRTPYLVTADAAFFSQRNEDTAHAGGVKRVAIPNRSTRSKQRKRLEKKRWFRNAQKWRTGC